MFTNEFRIDDSAATFKTLVLGYRRGRCVAVAYVEAFFLNGMSYPHLLLCAIVFLLHSVYFFPFDISIGSSSKAFRFAFDISLFL